MGEKRVVNTMGDGETAKRYLFIFAHPDDEVFIAGTMKQLITMGHEVYGVWVTSGEARGGRELRERELGAAIRIIGLKLERTRLLRLPNRGLLPILGKAVDAVSDLFEQVVPDRVLVTAYEGGHIDHDVVNFIAHEAAKRTNLAADLLEFPLYNRNGPAYLMGWKINRFPGKSETVYYNPLTDEAIDVKHQVMRIYASQWKDMAPFRLAMPRFRLKRYGEPYRPLSLGRDYTLPPHRGRLNYEGWLFPSGDIRFRHFKECIMLYRRKHVPPEK